MKLTVEMYGLSPFTDKNKTDIEIDSGSGIGEVMGALAEKIPAFKGPVIDAEKRKLIETYGLYINGQFIDQNESVQLREGDRVVIILLAVGG